MESTSFCLPQGEEENPNKECVDSTSLPLSLLPHKTEARHMVKPQLQSADASSHVLWVCNLFAITKAHSDE